MEYRFESLSEENLPHLVPLFKKVFNNGFTLDVVKKKYLNYIDPGRYYGHLAFYGDAAIGFSGAISQLLCHRGAIEKSSQSSDSMVIKSHNGKGIFTKLAQSTNESLKGDGIASTFGIPNQNNHYAFFNKVGWKKANVINRFHIPIEQNVISRYAGFLKLRMSRKILSPYETETPPSPSFSDDHIVKSLRDRDFYHYKKLNGDSFFIKIDTITLWIKISNKYLFIGDMDTPEDSEHFKKIIESLKLVVTKSGISEIIFQTSPGSRLESFYQKFYPAHSSWTLGADNFSSKWDLTMLKGTWGDFDTF